MLNLGIHVSKTSHITRKPHADIANAITTDMDDLGLNSAQIFTHGPQSLSPNKINYEKVCEATLDVNLTVHSAYPTTGIWHVFEDNKDTPKSKSILSAVKSQLEACSKIGAWGLVVHVNKQTPDDVANTMEVLKPIAIKYGVKIVLEMVASKSDDLLTYETPEKINNLTDKIGADDWWGWCVDTAHIWASGVGIQSYADMSAWLGKLKHPKQLLMFHLNGSSSERCSGKDKHEIAFAIDDKIWHGVDPKESGLRAVVEYAVTNALPIICEINRGAEKDARAAFNTIIDLSEF